MSRDPRLERLLPDILADATPSRAPEGLRHDITTTTGRMPPRPRWLAFIKERPMRISSNLAVGSPVARLATILLATLLLAAMATGAAVAGASLLAGPVVIVVAQDGTGTVTTIAEAVAMAEDGDTILVKPGTYPESLTITKDITLAGDGPREEVIIAFTEASPTILTCNDIACNAWPYALVLREADVTLRDLTARGPRSANAIVVFGGEAILEGLVVDLADPATDPGIGLTIGQDAKATVRDSVLEGWNEAGDGVTALFEGNRFADACLSAFGTGAHLTVRNNTFAGCPWDWGINNDPGSSWIIEGNDISNDGVAIEVEAADTDSVVVRDNVIHDSATGIRVVGRPAIDGNEILGNDVGIEVSSEIAGFDAIIQGNAIEDNGTGIVVEQGAAPVLVANSLCKNQQDLQVPDGAALTLEGNTVCEDAGSASPAQ